MQELNGQSGECKKKSGQQIAKEHVDKVRAYVEWLKQSGGRMPVRKGQPNWSAIALACGFSRGVFYDNDEARAVIEQAVKDEPLFLLSPDEPKTSAETGRAAYTQKKLEGSERRVQRLEEQLSIKTAENEGLKRENKELKEKLRQFSAFEEVMTASGKRYIP